jgi:hypothetical protein
MLHYLGTMIMYIRMLDPWKNVRSCYCKVVAYQQVISLFSRVKDVVYVPLLDWKGPESRECVLSYTTKDAYPKDFKVYKGN